MHQSRAQATQPAIFNDLAQEAVGLCRASLLNTTDAFRAKSAIDGQLFLVRHLFILRDIARNVDLAERRAPNRRSRCVQMGTS